jgi:hypothetical protein
LDGWGLRDAGHTALRFAADGFASRSNDEVRQLHREVRQKLPPAIAEIRQKRWKIAVSPA